MAENQPARGNGGEPNGTWQVVKAFTL